MSEEHSEIRCPYCGAMNTVGVFCQECGKRIKDETPKPIENPVPFIQPPPTMNEQSKEPYIAKSANTRKIIIAVLIGVIAVGLVFGALYFNLPKTGDISGSTTPTPTPAPSLTQPTLPPTLTPTATPAPTLAQSIEITGINLQIHYGTSDQGYFGAASQSVTISNQPNQILTVTGGQQFFLYFTLTESSSATADSINSVTVGTPGFTLVSVQPQTPIAFTPAGSTQITVTLTAPQTAFNGPIQLVLTTAAASST